MATNTINWYDIPTTDLDRAMKFYGTIFGVELSAMEAMPGFKMAMFPAENGVTGALVHGEGYVPSQEGSLLYLNGGDDLNAVLGRVEAAGGKVAAEKFGIGENGFVGIFIDSEGNKVGLHSMG